MPATIKIKNSSTASAVPTSSDLVQGELAVNVTDKRLFTENASGTVVELGTNPSILTLPDGSASAPTLTNDGDTNTGIFFPAADTVGITTGGTERARVDSSGNMGLGVTPSAWNAGKSIEINAVGNGIAGFASGNLYLTSNTYYNSAFKYATTAPAAAYNIYNGTHLWSIAASGTAGNNITFTQAMTLDASGNLGIGTTSPASYGVIAGYKASGTASYIVGANGGGCQTAIGVAGDNESLLGTLTNHALRICTNSTERARIDSSGNLLVGTTSAGGRLAVTAGSASQSPIVTSSVSGDTSFQAILVSKFDNNSTTSQNFIQFQINNGGANCGRITANGANTAAFGSTSDQRVKENIVDLPSQLANIMALRPVEYDYIESYGGGHQIGFIAQEMQQVYPDVISQDDSEENILSITGWSKTEARLVKAIQELKAIVDAQAVEIAALKG
jgi:hypothetical protein